ncbi:hypothetical protein K402DRAFT_446378 [Aulographum hederae CBS 113979]|uniref:dual-specificity kinase n=1 Tax=Aulographum hederae CBS 113979 TaxID=1176131 RepID=A0A6G1H100_9PEZI|nr:hypothetical protein K402DRAFT_446378 [Aulographum hederae CBS 113979]
MSSRPAYMDESGGSGAEGPARKRFQRAAGSENENPVRKSSSTMAAEQRPSFSSRRRSTLRDQKAPLLGPRPLDQSKRIPSASHTPSTNPFRQFLPSHNSEPVLGQPGPTSERQFGGSSTSISSTETPFNHNSTDFLPSVNFDDFHSTITSYDATLNNFPAPGNSDNVKNTPSNDEAKHHTSNFGLGVDKEERKAPVTRSQSLVRRLSTARRPALPPNANANANASTTSMAPPSAPSTARGRRQSTLPPSAANNTASRAPRKSVGPGILVGGQDSRSASQSRSSMASSQGGMNRTPSVTRATRRTTLAPGHFVPSEAPKLATSRNTKAQSFQPSLEQARQAKNFLGTPSGTPNRISSGMNTAKSPGKSPAARDATPSTSSGNKRQSTHVSGGLGARTISPTDARRLRRLSTAAPMPAMPQPPPTPQPDFMKSTRSIPSPALMPPRKSSTPSSARATPTEQTRKQPTSGLAASTASTSSMTSARGSQSGLPARNSQIMASRLPTPKARNVHSSAGMTEEEVPPVPAIPKAFESPKEQMEQPPFFPRKSMEQPRGTTSRVSSGVSAGGVSNGGTPPVRSNDSPADTGKEQAAAKAGSNPRHRRGLTVGSDAFKSAVGQHTNRKNLQPNHLPPLNLLPLSAPTATRIASFPAPSLELNQREAATPPPKRDYAKTPSTPMTASKSSFFSRSNYDEDYAAALNTRSASSHFHLKPDNLVFPEAHPSPEFSLPIAAVEQRNNTTTPFSSSSLPKSSGDFSFLRATRHDDLRASEDSKDFALEKRALVAPSPRLQPVNTKDLSSANTSTSDEAETPSSTTSLRRKLSLGWRRTSSKASQHPSHIAHQLDSGDPPKPPRHNDMPPPRLPASATWSGMKTSSPTPSNGSRPSLDSRRRKSSLNLLRSSDDTEKSNAQQEHTIPRSTTLPHLGQAEQATSGSRASTSILNPMQRMLGSRNSVGQLKARHLDPNLDKDDQEADKIMVKLASRRKDFEHAARDVDDLRKRARATERVSPSTALQKVNLNIFERGEIIDYREIYFCGTKSAKKHVGDLNAQTANFGYDDDRGDYNIVFGDHLAYRYEVVDLLGKGSFGQVVRCVDHKLGLLVAIKIIRNKKRFHQQALVEVNILQKLREWDPENKHSMINFTQSFYFRGHLCISTELLGMNLYEFIKAYEFKGFPLPLIRRFTKQMLSSLCLLKSKKVIHCDLKPENILLAHPLHSEIKVIDFGSSCFETEKVYTYIQSRFYRSPEVILGMNYGIPIDMWSVGCILAELLTGYPIFPGENEQEQLSCIMEIFGPPEKHLIEKSSRKKLFFDSLGKPRVSVSSKGKRRRPSSKTLQQALKCDDEPFLDFITRCLRWDPERRLNPDDAMHHEFITGIKQRGPSRVRSQANGVHIPTSHAATPMKRSLTVQSQTPQRNVSRPLPEPPATSFKNGVPMSAREVSNSASPIKNVQPSRRHSVFGGHGEGTNSGSVGPGANGAGASNGASGVKRGASNAVMNTSGASGSASHLPRVSQQRSTSGKADLASAAAVASLRAR